MSHKANDIWNENLEELKQEKRGKFDRSQRPERYPGDYYFQSKFGERLDGGYGQT